MKEKFPENWAFSGDIFLWYSCNLPKDYLPEG
jgi:hypothetical protein